VGLEVIASITHAVGLALTVVGAFYLLAKPRSPSGPLATLELLSYIVYLLCLGGWFSTALLRHSLFQLSSTIFEEAHKAAEAALAEHKITSAAECLKVDKLVSVPIAALLTLAAIAVSVATKWQKLGL
jgi:hypothetical protein